MAPQKRPWHEDGHGIVLVERASSSLRQDAQRKKVRLSINASSSKGHARDRSPSTSSSDASEEEGDEEEEGAAPTLPQSTQYEEFRESNYKRTANPAYDDQIATQRLEKRIKDRQLNPRIGDNRAANNAVIEDIICVNFMCHEHMKVELGPLINFIVGMNGSGKSAILTAITLCLGGKATATNRATSLKSLIKQGQDQAILTIKLKNQGHDAYQQDIFGKSIIIERHFSTSGSSGYKLKNANGKIVSTKKGDVDDIVEYFQLQVDNPMNVLSQDQAKTFITASTPSQKYDFFHKGVQLEALDNDYKLIYDNCDAMQAKLEDSKGYVEGLKQKHEEAKEKARMVAQQEGVRAQAKIAQAKLAWVQVGDAEEDLRKYEQAIVAIQDDIEQGEERVAAADIAFQALEEKLEHAKQAYAVVREELIPLQNVEEAAASNVDTLRVEIESARNQKKDIATSMNRANDRILKYEKETEEEKRRRESANGGAHSRKLQEIQQAEQAVLLASTVLETNKRELPQLHEARGIAGDELKKVIRLVTEKKREVDDARDRLQDLNQARGDSMAGFDRRMPELLNTIRADRGFERTPIGPIGSHIKLLEPKWGMLLESILGSQLTGFVVISKADQLRLAGHLRRFNMAYCPIVIGNDRPLTHINEPGPEFKTILRILNIENEFVKRQLIISNGIEQAILVADRREGMRIMFDGPRPQNVNRCYTFADGRTDQGVHLGYLGRDGGRDMSPVHPSKSKKPRLQSDIGTQVEYQREILRRLEDEMKNLEDERRRAQFKLDACEQALRQNKSECKKLVVDHQRAGEHVDDLRSELDQLQVEDGRIETLESLLADARKDLEIFQESYISHETEMKLLNNRSLAAKRDREAAKQHIADHELKIDKANRKVTNLEQARRNELATKNSAIENIQTARGMKERAERKRDQVFEQVKDWTSKATQISPRVSINPGETGAIIEAQYNKLKQQMKALRQRIGGTEKDINDAAVEAERVYQEARVGRRRLEELLEILKQTLQIRLKMYFKFRDAISAASRINFNYLLSERAFRGKLTIDHVAKKLDVHVEPDITKKGSKGRQTKTLSGGEKSFSSICLLLALWEAMGAPLRCLDEYDVFMDDINRDVSTKMIISAARRSVGRQFILITPKALGAGATEARDLDVTITKMFDPRQPRQLQIDEMLQ